MNECQGFEQLRVAHVIEKHYAANATEDRHSQSAAAMFSGILDASNQHVDGYFVSDDRKAQCTLHGENSLRILNIQNAHYDCQCRRNRHIERDCLAMLEAVQSKLENRAERVPVIRRAIQRSLVQIGGEFQEHRANGSPDEFGSRRTPKLGHQEPEGVVFNQLE